MANKQVDELVTVTGVLKDTDYMLVYDSDESGSEKLKKRPISNYVATINNSLTLYIASDGSDITGDGSSGTPWATIAKALTWLKNKFIATGGTITIQLADGTYNNQEEIIYNNSSNKILIKGNSTTPANVTLIFSSNENGIITQKNSYLNINGLKITGSNKSEWAAGFRSESGSKMYVTNCISDNWGVGARSIISGYIQITDCILNNCNQGNSVGYFSNSLITDSSVTNCANVGLYAEKQGGIIHTNITFSGNTLDTQIADDGKITSY